MLTRLRGSLLRWFARHARDLPWRRTRDPYAIWISEVMLQQTQVATVIPYFKRFLQRFPDMATLAGAQESAVLRMWEGLGYYRRGKALHRAARLIMQCHGGVMPMDGATLQQLPGFGRYTANAVLSQAHDARLPILEANSERVLCRLLGLRADPKNSAVRERLWQASMQLLPRKRVGAFNQALMELGALVCRPTKPTCPACPLERWCKARQHGWQERIPQRRAPGETVAIREVGLVIWKKKQVLLVQRAANTRWASLWEFPHQALNGRETQVAAARRLQDQLGIQVRLGTELATIRHGVTRFQITLSCLQAEYLGGRLQISHPYARARWVFPARLQDYPVSSPQRRLARLVFQSCNRKGARSPTAP